MSSPPNENRATALTIDPTFAREIAQILATNSANSTNDSSPVDSVSNGQATNGPSKKKKKAKLPPTPTVAPKDFEERGEHNDRTPKFLMRTQEGITKVFYDYLEWNQRKRIDDGNVPGSPWEFFKGPETANRNRYINIDPFAQNRIKLVVPTGRNAYINASPIKTTSTKNGQVKNFIATQGPRSDTCAHFWRMLWHETKSPAVIVMLTKLQEGGREKCFQYYPESMANPFLQVNQHDEYNDGLVMTVKLVSITRDPGSWTTIRELELIRRDTNESRKVFHLLFEGWPDFLVPEDQQALCNLVRLSQCKAKDLQNPRIVHCSAGVGRSGTFIALDWLLREFRDGSWSPILREEEEANKATDSVTTLKDGNDPAEAADHDPAKADAHDPVKDTKDPTEDTKDFAIKDIKDPIRDIVDQLREQRLTMVQSETQLAFLYKTMRGMWDASMMFANINEANERPLASLEINDAPRGG